MAFIMSWHEGGGRGGSRGRRGWRGSGDELYCSLGMRRDALFEACDALACRPERVHMLAELCLEPECRRGHGGVYDALNCGEVRIGRLRRAVDAVPLRPWDDGRIRLACDVSNWLRPDAETSPERLFCHCYARGKGNAQMIPGWPYSWVVGAGAGPHVLDAAAGRGPARPGRRRHRGHRRPAPRRRRPADRGRALEARATRTSSSSWTPATT